MNYNDYITPREKKQNKKLRDLTDEELFILRKEKKIKGRFWNSLLVCMLLIPYLDNFFIAMKYSNPIIAYIFLLIDVYSNLFIGALIGGILLFIGFAVKHGSDKDFFKRAREIKKKLK